MSTVQKDTNISKLNIIIMETVSKGIEHMQLGVTYSGGIFRKMEGQRDVKDSNVESLMKSIITNKGLIQPIVVDKSMRIIDGGNRLVALTRLNREGHKFPIMYVINNIAQPRAMMHSNIKKEDWKLINFLNFQKAQGDKTCKRVIELQREYSEFAEGIVADIMNTSISKSALKSLGEEDYTINEKSGRRVLDICRAIGKEDLLHTDEKLPHTLARFVKAIRRVVSMNENSFDLNILIEKAKKNPLYLFTSQKDNIERIVQVYNKGERKKINKLNI